VVAVGVQHLRLVVLHDLLDLQVQLVDVEVELLVPLRDVGVGREEQVAGGGRVARSEVERETLGERVGGEGGVADGRVRGAVDTLGSVHHTLINN
jgi:hypothetical protein